MGQAKIRGSFENRKKQAILQREQRLKQQEEYRKSHPTKPIKSSTVLPFISTIAAMNAFPFYNGFPYIFRRK